MKSAPPKAKSWLSIETSSPQVSLAYGEGDRCLRQVTQTENASKVIESLYHQLDVDFEAIHHCVISKGPGSYNGLRVGYAFLKGLLCLSPLPVIEVPTPLVLARAVPEPWNGSILILQNARRGERYGALVRREGGILKIDWQQVASEATLSTRIPNDVAAVVSYDFQRNDLALFTSYCWLQLFPKAEIAALTAHELNLPSTQHLAEIEPHYVREPVAT